MLLLGRRLVVLIRVLLLLLLLLLLVLESIHGRGSGVIVRRCARPCPPWLGRLLAVPLQPLQPLVAPCQHSTR